MLYKLKLLIKESYIKICYKNFLSYSFYNSKISEKMNQTQSNMKFIMYDIPGQLYNFTIFDEIKFYQFEGKKLDRI